MTRLFYVLILALLCFPASAADDVYQSPEAFVRDAFTGNPPKARTLAITDAMRKDVDQIMEHPYTVARTTYWMKGGRSAWVLEEIGKYKPITTGIVIDNDQIEQVKVLIYRESHGWQVRHGYFTDQFKGASLTERHKLSQRVENISGATMSVDALRNLGKLALYLHQYAARSE